MHIHTSSQEVLDLGFRGYTCNWGVHICGLYESQAEHDEILYGFMHSGDTADDLQLFVSNRLTSDEFKAEYATRYRDSASHLEDTCRFQLMRAQELYYPDGAFSPWVMEDNLDTFYRQSQSRGRRHIRATAEMSWALEAIPGVEHLMAYESRLNYFIPGKPWISICMYDVTRFSGRQIMNVLRTHPFTINGTVITENPYYIDPDSYLAEHAPQFLTRNGGSR